ncbi:helix-turn-helix domain-containing protein [Novosphingobium sp. 9U]|uniref:helix-turn-helix domain-containing protein n=1 Tax=Novosphingobium sp. 9U TaxID=2653158 RepID=UPI0012F1E152|nr:helix-turn-helix domain-containing protein [Novosphingobium sp. 9U]VWX54811.1 conserved hypothetical protein [Novosphingobium sp. 9U]
MADHIDTPSTPSPPTSVGDQLRAAREAQGLSLGDIAAQTRVAERQLILIEESRFAELAAPTYAVGFSRSYARAVGLDEREIASRVRRQIDAQPVTRGPTLPSFEPGDPARVPPSRIAWLAGLLAVVVVGALLVFWNDFLSPEGQLPELRADATQAAPSPTRAAQAAPPQGAPGGPVVLTATAPRVWIKVTDPAGNQLFQKEMAQGESYTVPAEAQAPQLRTARPDQLQITVGGRQLARLGDKPEVISGIVLTPAALLQRVGSPSGRPATGAAPSTPPSLAPGAPQANGRRSDVPPVPKMDDLLNGIEAPAGRAQDNPVSTTQL